MGCNEGKHYLVTLGTCHCRNKAKANTRPQIRPQKVKQKGVGKSGCHKVTKHEHKVQTVPARIKTTQPKQQINLKQGNRETHPAAHPRRNALLGKKP
jgi:tRNA A37 methylthiotransferase MiaB